MAEGGARAATEVELTRGRAASHPVAARPLQAGGSHGGGSPSFQHRALSPLFLNICPIDSTYKYSELTADFFSAEMAPWWKGVSIELGCQFQDWRGLTALVGLQQGWPPQQLEFRLTNQ